MDLPYAQLPRIGAPRRRRVVQAHAPLGPGETWTFTDLQQPGVITHLWFAMGEHNRSAVLRCYWDDEATPSVDVPLIDFFGGGRPLQTSVLTVAPRTGFSAHFPMPFMRRARLELTNVSERPLGSEEGLVVQVDYDVYKPEEMTESPGMFHAQWNRESPTDDTGRMFGLARAAGHGAYVGSTIQIRPSPDAAMAWHAAGGDLHLVDGAGRAQVLAGITGEHDSGDGGAHSFQIPQEGVETHDGGAFIHSLRPGSPIVFASSLFSLFASVAGDYSAVSYWYQHEPHRDFLIPVDAGAVATDANLPPGARDLPPLPQESIEWLCGDGDRKATSRHYFLNLNEYRRSPQARRQDGSEAIWATFTCPETRSGQFYISYDDHIKAILNDRLVFERERPDGFGVDPIAVMIPAGKNTVRIETTNRMNTTSYAWVIGLRIANSAGRTIEEIEFDTHPDIPEGII